MKENNYEIEYDDIVMYKEIIFENKVVGFIKFNNYQNHVNDLIIEECYIMPEFRGNN